jgi:hypothetical protein
MLTIRQTVNIPEDRRLSLELPKTAPVGKVTILLSLAAKGQNQGSRPSPGIEELKAEADAKYAAMLASGEDPLLKLRESLKGEKVFSDDIDYQRGMRDEWD